MSSNKQTMFVFLFGVIVGLLTWNLFVLTDINNVHADSGEQQANYIAVTGLVTNSFEGLWVLKVDETEHSPSLCLYVPQSSGRTFALTAARRIKYDFQLVAINDRSERVSRDLKVSTLKNKIREINEKEEN